MIKPDVAMLEVVKYYPNLQLKVVYYFSEGYSPMSVVEDYFSSQTLSVKALPVNRYYNYSQQVYTLTDM